MTVRTGWRRVLSEGAIIVVSILSAFAIDAWWDETREAAAERRVLDDIRQDLVESRKDLELVVSLNSEDIELAVVFLFEPLVLPELSPDSANVVLNSLFHMKTYQPVDGALRTADIGLIRDQDLRSLLGRWIGSSEDLIENTPAHHVARVRVEESAGLEAYLDFMASARRISATELLAALRTNDAFTYAVLMSVSVKQNSINKASKAIDITNDLISRLSPGG